MSNSEHIEREIKEYIEDYQSFIEWVQSKTPDFVPEKFIVFSTKCGTFNGEPMRILKYAIIDDGKWVAGFHINSNGYYDFFAYEIVQSILFKEKMYLILKRE